jgi:RimJ/RimL family protein N-acetyltransferase
VHLSLHIDGTCVRRFAPGDATSLAAAADNPRVARHLRDRFPSPYTLADARRWIDMVAEQDPPTSFAIATEGRVIGGIGLDPGEDVYRRSAELGYWLAEPYWGRGLATAAVRAVTDWAFANLDLIRVFARPMATNPASARVLEKAGYTLEGTLRAAVVKHGEVVDELVYAVVRLPARE